MRHSLFLAAMVIAISAQIVPSLAHERIALVVGNASYQGSTKLDNPVNDAKLIASRLRSVGFDVTVKLDSDFRSMAQAIRGFGRKLRAAGSDAVGLFFYAGHGVQVDGTNYMIPLEAELQNRADLEIEGVSAQTVLSQMRSAGNALNIVILDACRDNPFKGKFRSLVRGLARMNAPSGSLVAYAAAPGQVAADSDGSRNSPYSKALADALITPGLTLEGTFKKVRTDVERVTGGKQTPWEESSLKGDFYFKAIEPEPVKAAVTTALPNYERALELSFWDSIKESDETEAFEAYLLQFPNGTFAALARLKIKQLSTDKQPVDSVSLSIGPASGNITPQTQRAEKTLTSKAVTATQVPNKLEEKEKGSGLDGKWIAKDGSFRAEIVIDDGEFQIAVHHEKGISRGSGKINRYGEIETVDLQSSDFWQMWVKGNLRYMKLSGGYNLPSPKIFRFERGGD